MEKQAYYYGTGRRKCAVSRVRIYPGNGAIIVDGVPYEERFPYITQRQAILRPLLVTETAEKFNVVATVSGGGVNGQSEAIRHGIARALIVADERYRPLLRKQGLLTRDPRVKERKKPGLKRARKAPQYTKR